MPQYTLPALPYDYAALEPHYSAKLLELHHDRHHAAYVNGANPTLDKLAEARARGRMRRDVSRVPAGRAGGDRSEPDDVVFVVDDERSIREALESLMRSVGLSVATFPSARAFLDSRLPDAPACVVLDVQLPGLSGLDVQRELARAEVRLPIIFLTGHGDVPMSVQAMKAGAAEFLTKPFRESELLHAIRLALERDRTARRQRAELGALRRRYDSLTPCERHVMGLVAASWSNEQIAFELATSKTTAGMHRDHVMQKMAAESLPDLVGMAERLGLPPAAPPR